MNGVVISKINDSEVVRLVAWPLMKVEGKDLKNMLLDLYNNEEESNFN